MHREVFIAGRTDGAGTRISPDNGSVAAMITEFDVVDVRRGADVCGREKVGRGSGAVLLPWGAPKGSRWLVKHAPPAEGSAFC